MSTNIAAGARVWMHRIALPFFFSFGLLACGLPTLHNCGGAGRAY